MVQFNGVYERGYSVMVYTRGGAVVMVYTRGVQCNGVYQRGTV